MIGWLAGWLQQHSAVHTVGDVCEVESANAVPRQTACSTLHHDGGRIVTANSSADQLSEELEVGSISDAVLEWHVDGVAFTLWP